MLGIALSALVTAVVCGLPAFANESTPLFEKSMAHEIEQTMQQPGFRAQVRQSDCSHLVHSLYKHLGLIYPYATSRSLYRGIAAFRRVPEPESGDLVVWRGHVGIVVDPSEHRFLSALKSGVKTASYLSNYWRHVGRPHFFRYVLSKKINEGQDREPIAATEVVPEPAAETSD
jgi:hypothetical protein